MRVPGSSLASLPVAVFLGVSVGCAPQPTSVDDGADLPASADDESGVDFVFDDDDEAAVRAALQERGLRPFIRPRPIMLEVPWEHLKASGAKDTLVGEDHDDRPLAFVGPGQPPLKIFLNRSGGTYRPGQDDSRNNTSIVPRQTSTIGPFPYSDTAWRSVVDCVTAQFAAFNVQIVETEPPSNERYVEHVIGGSPGDLGLPNGVGGVAPIDNFNCNVIDVAINYTFAEVYGDVQSICETAAQEIAHSFSLDHELFCPDPMTYLGGCGNKSFQDSDQNCGEYSARQCNCGRSRQNSVQIMLQKLGAASGGGNPVEPPPDDPTPPVVAITSPADGANLLQDSTITITANATDNIAIAATELVWDFTGDVFGCPTTVGGGAVTCSRTGNVSTWNVRVGQGQRRFSVRARDTAGNVAATGTRTVNLTPDGSSAPPPVDDATPPSANIQSPADGAVLPANSSLTVTATANDDVALASVELLWRATGDVFPCPFQGQAVTCTQAGNTYTWVLNVGVGLRPFAVRAIDTAGQETTTSERTITLSTDNVPVNPDDPDLVGEPNNDAATAFSIRCGSAIDLVVASDNEDWFAVDAPADTAVEIGITSAATNTIGLSLLTATGNEVLATSANILGDGGALRAVSAGPAMLARITTPAGAVSYRLSATCSQQGGDAPPPGTDDALEDNDAAPESTRAFCGQSQSSLIAADVDWYVVTVREGDALQIDLTASGVQASVVDGADDVLAGPGTSISATNLTAGDYLVKVEPTLDPAYYDLAIECVAAAPKASGCGCSSDGEATPLAAVGGLAALLLLRRRRR
jgi:MYXO-CTERM domain-containing protein